MFFIGSYPNIYTSVVQEVFNQDRSPEVDDVEVLAVALLSTFIFQIAVNAKTIANSLNFIKYIFLNQ